MLDFTQMNRRILIVDDNPSIHDDFIKILPTEGKDNEELDVLLSEILGDEENEDSAEIHPDELCYTLDHAYQGEEAFEKVKIAESKNEPYALLFVDVRMPPGWDGIETIRRIWEEYPHNEIVICSAYSDYAWEDILKKLGTTDQLQFLRKPFDIVSIKQMALALTKKWNLAKQSRQYTDDLEKEVETRTKDLKTKIKELEAAMEEIKQLRGILPMCAWCKKVRNDDNFWQQVDDYLCNHTQAEISHGICPDCYDNMMDQYDDVEGDEDFVLSGETPKPPEEKVEQAPKPEEVDQSTEN